MRVLIADDHALFRDGLRSLLEANRGRVAGIITEVPTNPLIQSCDVPALATLAVLNGFFSQSAGVLYSETMKGCPPVSLTVRSTLRSAAVAAPAMNVMAAAPVAATAASRMVERICMVCSLLNGGAHCSVVPHPHRDERDGLRPAFANSI